MCGRPWLIGKDPKDDPSQRDHVMIMPQIADDRATASVLARSNICGAQVVGFEPQLPGTCTCVTDYGGAEAPGITCLHRLAKNIHACAPRPDLEISIATGTPSSSHARLKAWTSSRHSASSKSTARK